MKLFYDKNLTFYQYGQFCYKSKRLLYLGQVIEPSLDDIQHALNKATQYLLEVSRGIGQWGQQRLRMPSITELALAGKHSHTGLHAVHHLHEETGQSTLLPKKKTWDNV